MTDKTLGQVAYDALFVCREPDAKDEQRDRWWPALSPKDKTAWQAAAEAVVAATTAPNIVSGTIDTKTGNVRIHSPAELTARDKVIEAAKAYKHGWHNGQNMGALRGALFARILDLQELEKAEVE